MPPSMMDLVVRPLREYQVEILKNTGERCRVEVTLDVSVFLAMAAELHLVRHPADMLAPVEVAPGITIRPPESDYAGTTFTYRDLEGKTLHTATVDASGRASVTIIDDADAPVPNMNERRMIVLDGVIHIAGECCRELRCPRCGSVRHMTGGYNGPIEACERCDTSDFEPAPQHARPHMLDEDLKERTDG